MKGALSKAGPGVSDDECAVIFDQMDTNRDGLITFEEFATVYEQLELS